MGNFQSLSPATARAALKVANGKPLRVRLFDRPGSQNAMRAILISVDGDYAIVKPHGHGRNERVPMDTLRFWHAGNAHHGISAKAISEMAEKFKSHHGKVPAVLTDDKVEYVLISVEEAGVYSPRDRRFVANFNHPLTFNSDIKAESYADKVKRELGVDDIEVVSKEEAQAIVGVWVTNDMKEKAKTMVEAKTHSPQQQLVNHAPKMVIAPPPSAEMPSASEMTNEDANSIVSFETATGIQLSAILDESSDTRLMTAMAAKQKASGELRKAHLSLAHWTKKFNEAVAEIQKLTGVVSTATKKPRAASTTRRGEVPLAIRQVLSSSSRLSMAALVDKVIGILPAAEARAVKGSAYKMVATGQLINDDGNYSLDRNHHLNK